METCDACAGVIGPWNYTRNLFYDSVDFRVKHISINSFHHSTYLHLFHVVANSDIRRDKQYHERYTGKHTRTQYVPQQSECYQYLQRGRPQVVYSTRHTVHEPLRVHRHEIDNLTSGRILAGCCRQPHSLQDREQSSADVPKDAQTTVTEYERLRSLPRMLPMCVEEDCRRVDSKLGRKQGL